MVVNSFVGSAISPNVLLPLNAPSLIDMSPANTDCLFPSASTQVATSSALNDIGNSLKMCRPLRLIQSKTSTIIAEFSQGEKGEGLRRGDGPTPAFLCDLRCAPELEGQTPPP